MPDPPFPDASTQEGELGEVLKVRVCFYPEVSFYLYLKFGEERRCRGERARLGNAAVRGLKQSS